MNALRGRYAYPVSAGLLAVLCLHVTAGWSRGGPEVIDEAVIKKWQAYEVFSRSLQGTERRTVTSASGKTTRSVTVMKQNRDCGLICTSQDGEPTERCTLANNRYAAVIKRSKADKGGSVLAKFSQEPHGPFPGSTHTHSYLSFASTSPHFCVGTLPLSQFVTNPSFVAEKISKESENGRELIRIDFRDGSEHPAHGMQSQRHGTVYLDPSRCWCVRRSKTSSTMTLKGAPAMDQEHEYQFETTDDPSGFPLLKSRTSRDRVYSHRTKIRRVDTTITNYEWEVNDHVPDAAFTLSAFGLLEPGSTTTPESSEETGRKPIPWYAWALTAAGTCVAAGITFRWRARRRRVTPAA